MRCHADSFVTAPQTPPILTYDKAVQMISPYSQANRGKPQSACLTDTSPGRVDDDTLIACVTSSGSLSKSHHGKPQVHPHGNIIGILLNLQNIPNNEYLVGISCYGRAFQSPLTPIDGSEEQPCYHPGGLEGTGRFGGSDAAPNPCCIIHYVHNVYTFPSFVTVI